MERQKRLLQLDVIQTFRLLVNEVLHIANIKLLSKVYCQ